MTSTQFLPQKSAQLLRAERNARILWVIFSEENSERTQCRAFVEYGPAQPARSGAKGKQRAMTASLRRESKVFEFLEGGAAER